MKAILRTPVAVMVAILSLFTPAPLLAQDSATLAIGKAEYFFDTDPGFGSATPIAITAGQEVTVDDLGLAVGSLSPGTHLLGVRYRGTNGWSPTYLTCFFVPVGGLEAVAAAEYFFDTDPGFGQGTPIAITAGQEVTVDGLGLSVNALSPGSHLLGVRYRGTNGWSVTYLTPVFVPVGDGCSITTAEYFWNEDPGFDKGTPITLTPGEEVSVEDFGIPSFSVNGDAVLGIRYRGPQGWSPTVSFLVKVEAEGSYTLNAATATDAAARNYQTLGAAVTDFADRGVGADITVTIPASSAIYEMNATSAEALTTFAALGTSLDNMISPRAEKSITFTAAAGSGNTLAITTTDEGLPTVVNALSHTSMDNVSLTINGTVYDFSAAARRHDEICSGTSTTARSLSQISTAVNATWKAMPHSGTTVGGYLIDGEGDLPEMSLMNSGTKLDSLAYAVALTDGEGDTLTTYTYYIYVHPRVSAQAFSGMSPATGSSLDPGTVTLKWNAISGAVGGYEVTLSSVPFSDETAEPTVTHIDTDATSCTVTLEEGRRYTWTVTAIGFCDELVSPAMTLLSRTFDMNATDLAALRQLYADFNGNSWNGTKWDITDTRIASGNWSGVTFNAYGRVTAINLSRRGLVGSTLRTETLTPMTALTSLNLSYNQIDVLTGALPTTITSLNLNYQHRTYGNNTSWPGLENLDRQTVSVGQNGGVMLTSVIGYNHSTQSFGEHPELLVYTPSFTQLGTLTYSAVAAAYTFSAGSRILTVEQDVDVVLVANGSLPGKQSAMPATLHFVRGDANLSGLVDVNDVQRTLNYVLNSNNNSSFGLWSANTYSEYETEPFVNIQDIVCTVDIVLDQEENSPSAVGRRRMQAAAVQPQPQTVFYSEGRQVVLSTGTELAAFDLELEGVNASQVRLLLNGRDWQMTSRNTAHGVRLLVFSPTGMTLPVGTTELLRLGADGIPVAAQASSPEAEEVTAGVADVLPTGIVLPGDAADGTVYDVGGRKMQTRQMQKGIYIVNGMKVVK